MGACCSTRSRGSCCCKSNEWRIVPCLRIGFHGRRHRSKITFSDHVNMLQHLPSVPNRICSNGKSRASCVFTQQGRKGINQDAMIVWEDFMSEGVIFCGVFDGHGPHGHLVAGKVRDAFPVRLLSSLQSCELLQSGSCFRRPSEDDNGSAEEKHILLWRDAFLKSYKAMDKDLRSLPNLDCFCSGSTAVTIVKQGSNLFMGYIGDSRAIMGSKDNNDSITATQLTVDLKPDLPKESERIKRCRGRVFALQDEPEVPRVWLPFDDAPGLAMARAFGDFCLKEYGVISIPEFSHRVLTDRDLFVVLASDGVWDVLSNEEVVEMVSSVPMRCSAARVLVESAAREWKLKYPTSKMDDCAVVCLFLDGKMDSECYSSAIKTHDVDEEDESKPSLQRNFTVRSDESLAAVVDDNWLGLEGITRVNSLVQLPRFPKQTSTTT